MPLFALLACTEDEPNSETYLLNTVFKVKGMKNSSLMEEYVKEIGKTNNCDVPVSENSFFKKDDFMVYTSRLSTPDVTFMAFTNEYYPDDQAYDCLEEYKDMFFKKIEPTEIYNTTKDKNLKINGLSDLLKTYYKGDQSHRIKGLGSQVADINDKARDNLNKTKGVKEKTDEILYYTKKMNKDSEAINRKMQKQNQRKKICNCCIF